MKGLTFSLRAGWASLMSVTLWTGCVPEQSTVYIERVAKVDPTSCVATTTSDALPFGILDLGFGEDELPVYDAPLVVTTNLPTSVNTQTIQEGRQRSPNYPSYGPADSSIVTFESVSVYFTNTNGEVLPLEFLDQGNRKVTDETPRVTQVGGVVYNSQTNLGQQGLLMAPLISQEEARQFRNRESVALQNEQGLANLRDTPNNRFRVIANVQVRGRTSGGAELLSHEYSFPIELCIRCLVRVGIPADQENCPFGEELVSTDACLVGQDEVSSTCLAVADEEQ